MDDMLFVQEERDTETRARCERYLDRRTAVLA